MKLSEAIRLGAMTTEQAFRIFARRHEGGEVVATCAIGAAFHALGLSFDEEPMASTAAREWGFMNPPRYHCPACRVERFVAGLIEHLNDDHRWTREQIADWIEREIEAKQEQPQIAETVTV